MTTFLRVLQEAGQHGAEAVEHGTEVVQQGVEQVAEGGVPDIGGMLMHHLGDSPEIALPWGVWQLPQFGDIGHFLGFPVNLSPTKHVVFMALAGLIVCVLFLTMARAVRGKYAGRAPGGMANALEAIIIYFRDEIVRRNIGHGADGYTPFILTLFFFILTMNLLGLVPWGSSPTGNIMVTGALAVVSLVAIEISGFVTLGPAGYAKTIFYAPKGMGPVGTAIMLVIMTPVELVGKLAKPFALMVRLFANMTAGHTVLLSLIGLIFVFGNLSIGRWGIAVGSVGMSAAMMMLEIFVAFLQAYIFAMLTSVFIGLIRHAH
ncbi:MAG: F0F1 ATP synthase subunit A [Desulfobacterales bacterium]|nr:F0F1 ATP synthase subunit A [Desulfobacterales bacterium]